MRSRWREYFWPMAKGEGLPFPDFLGWIPGVFKIPESEVLRKSGLDSLVYLRVQKMCIKILTIICFFGLVVLFPVFHKGGKYENALKEYTISNLPQQSDLLWGPAIMAWVFTGVACYYIISNYFDLYKLRLSNLGNGEGHEYTVLITGIPDEYNTDLKVLEFVEPNYPGEVVAVRVVRDEQALTGFVKELRNEHLQLLRAQKRKVDKGNAKVYTRIGSCGFCGCGEKVEAIPYHIQRINELKEAAKKAKSENSKFCNAAFVTFDSVATAAKASATPFSDHIDTWQVNRAPKPKDVLWENLEKAQRPNVKRCVVLAKNALICMIVVFWSAPVAFVNAFSNLDTLAEDYPFFEFIQKMSPSFQAFVTGFIPTILLLLLMLALYPIVWYLIKSTGISSRSQLEFEFMGTYYTFLVINIFLLTLISTSVWSTIQEIIDSPKLIFELLGNAIPIVAIVEIQYIVLQAFLVEPEGAIRVWELIVSIMFYSLSHTEVEQKGAVWRTPFQYGYFLATTGLIFTICICYSCIAPLILPFGILYFCINYIINKYKLLYVHALDFETHGSFFPRVARHMFVGMIIGHVSLMGVTGLKYGYYQQALLFPLPLLTYYLAQYMDTNYGEDMQNLRIPLTTAASKDQRKSKDKVREFLARWHAQQCWVQPAVVVDLDNPLKAPAAEPVWEDEGGVIGVDVKVDVKASLQASGRQEHAPLLQNGTYAVTDEKL